jgi:GntR family transcriptional regulator/MocR family aminotransferase
MDLNISRNTVDLAYQSLFAEGFIKSKPRIGYFVDENCELLNNCENDADNDNTLMPGNNLIYDFRCEKLLTSELPCALWNKLINRCFDDYRGDMAEQKSVFGDAELRTEIRKVVYKYRNVNCVPEQIIITPDIQFSIELICRILKSLDTGPNVAMEEPGLYKSRDTFKRNGLNIRSMGMDQHGASANTIQRDVIAAYITPSHQFPTGVVMSLPRRIEFANWAKRKGAYIIEDDCNCFFHHFTRPLPSVNSLAADKVFYIGGFSDLLFPCLSVSYLVVPEKFLDILHSWYDGRVPFVSFLMQKPLELFIKDGHLESHLRKMKKLQRVKCETLVNTLNNKFGETIRIIGFNSGLHLLVQAKWPIDEDELIRSAHQAGVGVYPTSNYWSGPKTDHEATVLLNYGGISVQDIPPAVDLLYKTWRGNRSGSI